jgi:hypothetical protein
LEADETGASAVEGTALANYLRERPGCFVFLNSCASAINAPANPFSGIAQRLITEGSAGAVVAMQRPVEVAKALHMARRFFHEISRGILPEEAFTEAIRPSSGRRDAAVPCLYSQLLGPEEETVSRLRTLLNVDPEKSSLHIYLPHFRMGLLKQHYIEDHSKGIAPQPGKGRYHYRGDTVAKWDLLSAWVFAKLFLQCISRSRIPHAVRFIDAQELNADPDREASHYLMIGSRSQSNLSHLLKKKSSNFAFDYSDGNGLWTITDLKANRPYTVQDPSRPPVASGGQTSIPMADDVAILEKIIDTDPDRTIFVVAGFTDKGTFGAAKFFERKWETLQKETGRNPFSRLLHIDVALGQANADPRIGEPGPAA